MLKHILQSLYYFIYLMNCTIIIFKANYFNLNLLMNTSRSTVGDFGFKGTNNEAKCKFWQYILHKGWFYSQFKSM